MISLLELGSKITPQKDSIEIGMTGVHIFPIENSRDVRGSLAIVDFTNFTPFAPQRIFYTFDVPPGQDRGNHAHRQCHQFLVALNGECSVSFDNGNEIHQVRLDSSIYGISLPPMVWSRQFDFSSAATLLVLASESYKEDDYIRDYDEYLRIMAKTS